LLLNTGTALLFILVDLSTHKVEERDMHTEKGLVTLFELDHILSLYLIVSCDEEGFKGLTSEVIFLLFEAINSGVLITCR
jgi:hypothetical protein